MNDEKKEVFGFFKTILVLKIYLTSNRVRKLCYLRKSVTTFLAELCTEIFFFVGRSLRKVYLQILFFCLTL